MHIRYTLAAYTGTVDVRSTLDYSHNIINWQHYNQTAQITVLTTLTRHCTSCDINSEFTTRTLLLSTLKMTNLRSTLTQPSETTERRMLAISLSRRLMSSTYKTPRCARARSPGWCMRKRGREGQERVCKYERLRVICARAIVHCSTYDISLRDTSYQILHRYTTCNSRFTTYHLLYRNATCYGPHFGPLACETTPLVSGSYLRCARWAAPHCRKP